MKKFLCYLLAISCYIFSLNAYSNSQYQNDEESTYQNDEDDSGNVNYYDQEEGQEE